MGRLSKKKPGGSQATDTKSQSKITGFFQAPTTQPFTKIGETKVVENAFTSISANKVQTNVVKHNPVPNGSKVQPAISKAKKNSAFNNTSNNKSATDFHNSFLSPVKDKNLEELEIIEDSPVALKQQNRNVKEESISKVAPCKRKLDNDDIGTRKKVKNDEAPKKIIESAAPENEIKNELDGMEEDIDFGDDFNDDFEDVKFDVVDSGDSDVDMPLAAKYNRHKILEIDDTVANQLILILEDQFNTNNKRKAIIKNSWLQTIFTEGDIVHIEGNFQQGVVTISDLEGSIIVNPDMLVSGTSVVSALFCLRKAVLSEIFKGGGGRGNKVMLVGTMVHQLFQDVLDKKEYKKENITDMMNNMIQSPSMIREMAYLGLTEDEMRKSIHPFINHIQYFVKKYIHGEKIAQPEPSTPDKIKKGMQRPQWTGRIDNIADIEENIWSPRLGIKGKIDLTVKTAGNRKLLPLELKTGRPSFSAEHAGQVKLYTMMSRDRREDPGSGLLLYLRSSNMVEIPAGKHEERGLVQLRNQLVAYLSQLTTFKDDQVSDLVLPEPIDFEKGCLNCDLRDVCCTYLTVNSNVPRPPHHMAEMAPSTLQHLNQLHLDWFKRWSDMLRLEANESKNSNQKALWTQTAASRETTGNCISGLSLASVKDNIHTFHKFGLSQVFQAGEVVVVSSSTELALSQGAVIQIDNQNLVVRLDRNLPRGSVYHVDRHVYQGAMGSNFIAIGKLLLDTPEAQQLRSIIIEGAKATYVPGLPKDVAIIARGLIKNLNKVQQKAIFRSLMAEKYCLLRGMPGSGKSTTIVGLIRLLAGMGQSVLLVAYTNSAVDTVLTKLQEHEKQFLRLGRAARVRPELEAHTAEHVGSQISSCDELAKVYASYRIIGTTCLATDHAAIVNRKFDWCIVDEASQALLPSVVHPLLHANKFILVGDPAQLPPVVQSHAARKLGLHQSLFDLLDHESATISLNIQYRMNKVIAALANHLTYKGKLECATETVATRTIQLQSSSKDECEPWIQKILSSQLEDSVVFLDTNKSAREESINGGILNIKEANFVKYIIKQMIKHGLGEKDIAVIAPYSAQVKHLQVTLKSADLSGVEVGTVDQFQGRDCLVVIYSCTRSFIKPDSEDKDGVRAGHILSDERRLNVAITRAKCKLVLVGCLDTLVREYKPFRYMKSFLDENRIVQITNKPEF